MSWTTNTFDCCIEWPSCAEGWLCGCCQASAQFNKLTRNIAKPDDLCTLMNCCFLLPITTCHVRQNMRARYGIEGDVINDVCCTICCLPCTITQQHREMAARGEFPGGVCVEGPMRNATMGAPTFSTTAFVGQYQQSGSNGSPYGCPTRPPPQQQEAAAPQGYGRPQQQQQLPQQQNNNYGRPQQQQQSYGQPQFNQPQYAQPQQQHAQPQQQQYGQPQQQQGYGRPQQQQQQQGVYQQKPPQNYNYRY